ncbi:MAG: twin-arginine translocase subunit TatB [Gammaproteobacteria bacterium]|nr:Sec-independent protein translocase protein TatB [Gammaproteobacteria bacterium]MDE1887480.1 twin-arginine translocase subunit TatB [Gammaproteobacteria bacterium]MDE2023319.1 twin-arginine translocase subunit TatB [Gammaproteobacteria bacterium]MDE2140149.1 twin-arginine translocase subunit TatB [Gammaproteobacteria bacterium]MDE2273754.1 twin-arginine translocase subunit TatB [Gammaproteobacteria bacterium]
MLEGSFWELALIFVLALVVFGPERLPGLARSVGLWVGRARAVVRNVSAQIERELEAEELRKAAGEVRDTLQEPVKQPERSPNPPQHSP